MKNSKVSQERFGITSHFVKQLNVSRAISRQRRPRRGCSPLRIANAGACSPRLSSGDESSSPVTSSQNLVGVKVGRLTPFHLSSVREERRGGRRVTGGAVNAAGSRKKIKKER